MRELTFARYLKRTVRLRSRSGTTSIRVLAGEAQRSGDGFRALLLLYAVYSGKSGILAQMSGMDTLYGAELLSATPDRLDTALTAGALPEAYLRVWSDYVSSRDRGTADSERKEALRQEYLSLQQDKGFSNYCVCLALGINQGNFCTWLKHGEAGKISLNAARSAVCFAQEL